MIETGMRTPPADASLAVTEQYAEAYNLNVKIHTSMQAIQQNLYDMCSALKQMRDGKLYRELGYQNFEDYCEQGAGIARRHAYRFIGILERLPSDFVTSMSQIGMTKLSLLTALTDDQREEIAESVDLSAVTVKQLQQEIYKIKEKAISDEQARLKELTEKQAKIGELMDERTEARKKIAALQAAKDTAEADAAQARDAVREAEEAKERNRLTLRGIIDKKVELVHQLEAKVKELESRPVETAVVDHTEEIDALKAEIEQLRAQLAEKPDTQLQLGVEPLYQTDTKALFKPYLTAAADAVNRLAEFIAQHQSDANYDFFMEKMHAAFAFADQKIQAMKG